MNCSLTQLLSRSCHKPEIFRGQIAPIAPNEPSSPWSAPESTMVKSSWVKRLNQVLNDFQSIYLYHLVPWYLQINESERIYILKEKAARTSETTKNQTYLHRNYSSWTCCNMFCRKTRSNFSASSFRGTELRPEQVSRKSKVQYGIWSQSSKHPMRKPHLKHVSRHFQTPLPWAILHPHRSTESLEVDGIC